MRKPLALMFLLAMFAAPLRAEDLTVAAEVKRGVVAVIGVGGDDADDVVRLAAPGRIVYVQCDDRGAAKAIRLAAEAKGVLGVRLFVDEGDLGEIHLASNVADRLVVAAGAAKKAPRSELLRVLVPQGIARVKDQRIVKPVPKGYDDWSHPYHGPDNNPQSKDSFVRGRFQTHFLATPKFSPMPEQSVVAGGRIYKAMGHIAHKANQNKWLNQLLCINAYNGVILWQRELPKGFMIHRNTMIATDDALLLGDHESVKVIDAETGETRDEITIPADLTDGPVWKWMAVRDGKLFGLVGNLEVNIETVRSSRPGLGHWPWGMWKGHDYKDPRTAFGFGRTFVAIDLKTNNLIWHYRDEQFLDARAVCMNNDQIFFFTAGHFLASLDPATGSLNWKNTDADLLEAIGPNQKAQHYKTGYATTCYMKCGDDQIFFAGPQRKQLVAASTKDGSLMWSHPVGNLQLVLRKDALYAAGEQGTRGVRLDYDSGGVLSQFPARRACTRATGCADSIFFRASGGTVRVLTDSNQAQHIGPMRPPCQDGVIVSNGHLYWGPWMCGCQLSLYGNICLEPAESISEDPQEVYGDALVVEPDGHKAAPLSAAAGDWSTYRGGSSRNDVSASSVPDGVEPSWKVSVSSADLPTAPIVAGDFVFLADRTGAVHAFDRSGKRIWKAHTSAPVYYSPELAEGRLIVGSADGRVYAFEATTGRRLWTFRVAPKHRWIPVYGKLISRWPVSGGVAVREGTVYAAAGIAHYDGTYVVALDAATGKLKASNITSGVLAEQVDNGVSMQGNLSIVGDELQFLGGGVYEVARYDLATLDCLNKPKDQVTSQFRTAFYPLYPAYGKYVSLDHVLKDGSLLSHDASYEGSVFNNLALEEPLPPGETRPRKEVARWNRRRGLKGPKTYWRDEDNRRFTSFVVTRKRLLAAAHKDRVPQKPFLVATNIRDGKDLWRQDLPANAVKGGVAIDAQGNVYAALENGELHCFRASAQ